MPRVGQGGGNSRLLAVRTGACVSIKELCACPLGRPEMEEEAWGLVGGWAEAQRVRGPGGGVVLKMGLRQMVCSVRKMACSVRIWAPFEPCTAQDGSKTSRESGFTLR